MVGEETFGASGWWEDEGSHKLLHIINPVRLRYVKEQLGGLAGKKIADVGCGGGIFAEALAGAGASVVAVDPSSAAIETATNHAAAAALPIDYQVGTAASLLSGDFDAVTCMEVLEHTSDPAAEVAACAKLLKPSGRLFTATINRTPVAYLSMIVALEKVLQILPDGSHQYGSFIRPDELGKWCKQAELEVVDVVATNWNFFAKAFLLSRSFMPANYMLQAKLAS